MQRKLLIALVVLLCVVLAAGLVFIAAKELGTAPTEPTVLTTLPTQTQVPDTTATECLATLPVTEPTTEPTTAPTTEPPQPEYFTLTFVGDCTLGSTTGKMDVSGSFINEVGEDYGFPFRNVSEYFQNDDCTFVNLEGVFADEGTPEDKQFTFRAPVRFAQILTVGSVEAVTLANNHSYDFGVAGFKSTTTALDDLGVRYAERNGSVLFTTETGLTIGLYGLGFQMNEKDVETELAEMRDAGAELLIVAMHCGDENVYTPSKTQEKYAKRCIDLGADIVWGHHPHVLQKIEEYNGGIIYYSLGNFSFGGNRNPSDKDSAVLQQEIIRDVDGTVRLGELTIIPCSVTSVAGRNNFQPTPYEAGSEGYERVMSKLSGTYARPGSTQTGPATEPTTEPTTEPVTEPETGPTYTTDPAEGTESP